nr:DUF4258 domain-containing protein [Lichenifustis flavocetrariae]
MATFVYSNHALDMLVERSLERAWVERTVLAPAAIELDPKHTDRTRAYRAVPERDGRVLRVVYSRYDDHIRIITLFLDRGRRHQR